MHYKKYLIPKFKNHKIYLLNLNVNPIPDGPLAKRGRTLAPLKKYVTG